MSLVTDVKVIGRNCECEIEIDMINSERSTIDPRPYFIKRSHIIKICHYHEMEVRKKMFNEIKKSKKGIDSKQELENMQNYLNDLSNEIKNT